jgi:tRNA U54 and U55 pseudouridine synthase Pus10
LGHVGKKSIGDAFKAHMDFGLRKTGKSTKYHKCHYCEGTCTSGDMGAAAGVKHLRDCPKVPAEVRGAAKQALEETEKRVKDSAAVTKAHIYMYGDKGQSSLKEWSA